MEYTFATLPDELWDKHFVVPSRQDIIDDSRNRTIFTRGDYLEISSFFGQLQRASKLTKVEFYDDCTIIERSRTTFEDCGFYGTLNVHSKNATFNKTIFTAITGFDGGCSFDGCHIMGHSEIKSQSGIGHRKNYGRVSRIVSSVNNTSFKNGTCDGAKFSDTDVENSKITKSEFITRNNSKISIKNSTIEKCKLIILDLTNIKFSVIDSEINGGSIFYSASETAHIEDFDAVSADELSKSTENIIANFDFKNSTANKVEISFLSNNRSTSTVKYTGELEDAYLNYYKMFTALVPFVKDEGSLGIVYRDPSDKFIVKGKIKTLKPAYQTIFNSANGSVPIDVLLTVTKWHSFINVDNSALLGKTLKEIEKGKL